MYMMHCRTELDEFGVKNAESALQTRRNSLLAKYFANSEIPRWNSPMAKCYCPCQLFIGLLAHLGACSAVRSFSCDGFQLYNPYNIQALHITSNNSWNGNHGQY